MVAVTGASGLVGRHLVEKLVTEGVIVVAIVRNPAISFPSSVVVRQADILDPPSLQAALEGVSTVVHAAGFVSFNPRRRKEISEVNVLGTRHLVNLCLHLGVKNLIHISSVSALGRKPGETTTENHIWTGLFATDYALSKYLAELEVFRGAEEGLTVSLVNPSIVLSGSQPHRSSASLFDYVWKEMKFFANGTLNYVDARDVADAVYHLVLHPQPGEKFILSAGNIRLQEFFERAARHWGKRAPSVKIPLPLLPFFGWAEEIRSLLLRREPMITRYSASVVRRSYSYENSKAQVLLNTPFRSIDDSISWCCNNYAQNIKGNK